MRTSVLLFLVLASVASLAAQPATSPWAIPLTVEGDSTYSLRFGTADGATDGWDYTTDFPVLSMAAEPPGVWFYIPGGFREYFTTDFRDSRGAMLRWELHLLAQSGPVNFYWEADSIPEFAMLRIGEHPSSGDSVAAWTDMALSSGFTAEPGNNVYILFINTTPSDDMDPPYLVSISATDGDTIYANAGFNLKVQDDGAGVNQTNIQAWANGTAWGRSMRVTADSTGVTMTYTGRLTADTLYTMHWIIEDLAIPANTYEDSVTFYVVPPDTTRYRIFGTVHLGDSVGDLSGSVVSVRAAMGPGRADTTDAAGAYEVGGQQIGQVTVSITSPGFARFDTTFTLSGDTEINVTLTRAVFYTVRGVVALADMPPTLEGSIVRLGTGRGAPRDTTDPGGNYLFTGVTGGNFAMRATHTGYIQVDSNVVISSDTVINFTLGVAPVAALTGTVYLEGGGPDLSGSLVQGGAMMGTLLGDTTAADGTYRIEGITPGNIRFHAEHAGWTAFDTVFAMPAEGLSFSCTLHRPAPGITVDGHVYLDPTGPTLRGSSVALQSFSYADTMTTDEGGAYVMNDVPTGWYNIIASHTGYTSSPLWTVFNITADTTIDFTLTGTGVESFDFAGRGAFQLAVGPNPVHGSAAAYLMMPQAGEVTLTLYDLNGRSIRSVKMSLPAGSTQGQIDFGGLGAGAYRLVGALPGMRTECEVTVY